MAGTIGVRKIGLRFFNGWLGGLLGVALALAVTQPSAESQEKAANVAQSQLRQFEPVVFLDNSGELNGSRHFWENALVAGSLSFMGDFEHTRFYRRPNPRGSASQISLEQPSIVHHGDRSNHHSIHLLSLFEMPQSDPNLYAPERHDTQDLLLKPLFTNWAVTEVSIESRFAHPSLETPGK